MNIELLITETIKDVLGYSSEISLDKTASLADHGLNSTGILDLVLKIEDKLSIRFSDDIFNIQNFETVASFINYVAKSIDSTNGEAQ